MKVVEKESGVCFGQTPEQTSFIIGNHKATRRSQ